MKLLLDQNNNSLITLTNHLAIADENRNQAWDEKFFKLFSESHLKMVSADPQQGPDSWPYLIAEIVTNPKSSEDKSAAGETIDSAQKILQWLSTRGIGLVVNPYRLPHPDFVLTYGMIWSFRETGFFNKYQQQDENKQLLIENPTQAVCGEPTLEFLPQYVRKVLKDFFLDQSVFDPKVLMFSADGKNFDLCFSLESLGNQKAQEHQGVLEALSWFLPPHYSLALISEKNLPAFKSL